MAERKPVSLLKQKLPLSSYLCQNLTSGMERKPRPGKSSPEQSSKETRKPSSGKGRASTGRAGSRTPKPYERKETSRSAEPGKTHPDKTENSEFLRKKTAPGRVSNPEHKFKSGPVRRTSAENPDYTESPRRRTTPDRDARPERDYKSSPGRKIYTEKSEDSEPPRRRTSSGKESFKQKNYKPTSTRRDTTEKPDETESPRYRKSPGSDYRADNRKDDKRPGKPFSGKKEGYGRPKPVASGYSSGKRPSRPAPGNNDGLIRLNKYIANSGICSRREADELILAGVVMVNGKVVTELGTKVSLADKVQYDNHTIRNEKHVYVLLNKPKGYITTTDDPFDRKTVMTLVSDACKERIYPVGRLDRNTTGLLLLTNDGDIAKKLTHPRHRVKKVYHVELDKAVTKSDMIKMATEGVELEDGVAVVDEVAYAEGGSKKEVGVELHSGKNRIVRRIFEALGYEVVKLDRLSFAGLTKKDLPRGKWRLLTEQEVNYLKMLK